MRLLAAIMALAVAACDPPTLTLTGTPVPLDRTDPARRSVGALTYVGGLDLTANASLFGGLSGLEAVEDGGGVRLGAVSDQGDRFLFGVDVTASGLTLRPGALTEPLLQGGKPLGGKAVADAEGLTSVGDTDTAVSFERRHRIVRYIDGVDSPLAAPSVPLPDNGGLEALAELPLGGRRVMAVGAEDGRIWFCEIAPTGACTLFLDRVPAVGFELTSLDHLPGTADLVALYRAYDPVQGSRAIVAWIGTGVTGDAGPRLTPLARLSPPLTIDNMEGIAAVALPGRGWRLFVVSDDNFSDDQRTLLLAFDWLPPPQPATTPPAPPRPPSP